MVDSCRNNTALCIFGPYGGNKSNSFLPILSKLQSSPIIPAPAQAMHLTEQIAGQKRTDPIAARSLTGVAVNKSPLFSDLKLGLEQEDGVLYGSQFLREGQAPPSPFQTGGLLLPRLRL